MDPLKGIREDVEFNSLLEDLKMQNLSQEFEKLHLLNVRNNKLKKAALFLAVIGVSTILFFSLKDEVKTNVSSKKSIEFKEENLSVILEDSLENKISPTDRKDTLREQKTPRKKEPLSNDDMIVFTDSIPKPKITAGVKDTVPKLGKQTTVDNPKIEQNNTPPLVENLCEKVKIIPVFKTFAACDRKEDGQIRVLKTTGGTAPYIYILDNKTYYSSTLDNLSWGTYTLHIEDKNNCLSNNFEIEIAKENCPDERELVYSFAKNNEVIIALNIGDKIKILDYRGLEILNQTMEEEEFIFHPNNLNNQILLLGKAYTLQVQNLSGKVKRYEISVLP